MAVWSARTSSSDTRRLATTAYIETNRNLRAMHPKMVEETIGRLRKLGATVERDEDTDLFTINGEFTASLVLSRCRRTESGDHRWDVVDGLCAPTSPSPFVWTRPTRPLDYYLLPRIDMTEPRLRLAEDNGVSLDAYRFETLEEFFGLAARARLLDVA